MVEHTYPINYPEMIVPKADGVTASEKKLISLGYKKSSFLCITIFVSFSSTAKIPRKFGILS